MEHYLLLWLGMESEVVDVAILRGKVAKEELHEKEVGEVRKPAAECSYKEFFHSFK